MSRLKTLTEWISKRKWLVLYFFIILIFLLGLTLLYFVEWPPLPNEVDIEIKRNSSAALCERRWCIYQWIEKYQSNANVSQLNQMCSSYNRSAKINKSLEIYSESKIDWKFLLGFYDYLWRHYCHRHCRIDGLFRYFQTFLEYQLQYSKAWVQYELCIAPYDHQDACAWRAYSLTFRIYFSYFSIPGTVILNFINLTTLLQVLGKNAGTALYLHAAEIITDGLLNIVVGVHDCLWFFLVVDRWRATCGYQQYTSFYQSMDVVKRYLSLLNQVFLVGLVADRLYAMAKPYQYNISDFRMKKRARSIMLNILIGSVLFYFPFFIFRTFRPVFLFWKTVSDFWKVNLNPIDATISTSYVIISFSITILQLVCGVLVEKKYRKYIKRNLKMDEQKQKELKKKERDKQLLLAGTIGLNVATGLVSAAFLMANTIAFYELLGYSDRRPWWQLLFYMGDTILTFINGNGALIIHIIFVKSYRKAFKATFFGKLVYRKQNQPAPAHPNEEVNINAIQLLASC